MTVSRRFNAFHYKFKIMIKENSKEFLCRQCNSYLDTRDLIKGCCPNGCDEDDLFINENSD